MGFHLNGLNNSQKSVSSPWIFNFGATDTMTYDARDLTCVSPITRTYIQTASVEKIDVLKAGSVNISPKIHLENCLFIPNLCQNYFLSVN